MVTSKLIPIPQEQKLPQDVIRITNTCDIENPSTQSTEAMKSTAAEGHLMKRSGSVCSCSSGSGGEGDSFSSIGQARRKSNIVNISLILFLGALTCAAFLAIGMTSAKQDQVSLFDRRADDLVNRIQRSTDDYVTAAAWIHGRCRGRNFTRADFRQTYEYLINSGLNFQAAQFDPNITNEERPAVEEEARKFYEANYPTVNYRGFVGFNDVNSTSLEPRNEAEFYFPIHYMEPVVGNEPAIDLDYHASGSRKETVLACMNNGLPALTDRLVLVQEKTESAYGVVLMHPGFALSMGGDVWPRDLASIVIRIPDLLRRAAVDTMNSMSVYMYDASEYSGGPPAFLGGADIVVNDDSSEGPTLDFLMELELQDLRHTDHKYKEDVVQAANKNWIIVVHAPDGSYQPEYIFVILGGVVIFIASALLAYWVHVNSTRMDAFNTMRAQAESERAALILDNARKATKAERELNDFIAHEVSTVVQKGLIPGRVVAVFFRVIPF